MSLMQVDVDTVRDWRVSSRMRISRDDMCGLMLEEAYDVIRVNFEEMCAAPLDLSGIEVWGRLWECCTYVSRIVAFPTVRPVGVVPFDYVSSVALMCGMVLDVCASGSASLFSHATERELSAVRGPGLVDIICGRGGALANVMRDMVFVNGSRRGVPAGEVLDALSKLRMNNQVRNVAKRMSLEPQVAARDVGAEFLHLASVFDAWQTLCHSRSRSDWFDFSPETVKDAIDMRVLESHAEALENRPDCGFMSGWCHDLSFTPVFATTPLTRALCAQISSAYESKKLAELTVERVRPIIV